MKTLVFLVALLTLSLGNVAHADGSPQPAASAGVPVLAGPTPSNPAPTEAVAIPAAPPQWAQDLMVGAEKLPVIGPIANKVLLYLGIVSALLTLLVTFLTSSLTVLSGAFTWVGLTSLSASLIAFRDGKVMYWIKYLSMFNAKKPEVA